MFYLTLNERAINKGVCDFNDCDYRLINRLNKKDKTIFQISIHEYTVIVGETK